MSIEKPSDRPADSAGISSTVLAASISAGAILCTNGIAIFERSGGLLSNAGDGLASDLLRLFCFYVTGMLVYRIGKGLWHVPLWIIALNLIDKGFVIARVATIQDEAINLSAWKLLVGGIVIYAVTIPLALAVAFAGYFTAMYFSAAREEPFASASLGRAFLAFALSALLFPIVYALNFYALLLIHEFPIFYLALSHRSIGPAFYIFIAAATLAATSWAFIILSRKRVSSLPSVIFGGIFLVMAVLLHIAS